MFYEYSCSCGHVFTKKFSFVEVQEETPCPKCNESAKRKFSVLNFQWKKGQELR